MELPISCPAAISQVTNPTDGVSVEIHYLGYNTPSLVDGK